MPCSGTPGAVRVSPKNKIKTTGCVSSLSGSFQPAIAKIQGTGKIIIKVTPATTTLATTGVQNLSIDTPKVRVHKSTGTTTTVTLKTSASTAITVGMTAHLAAGQLKGTYTGSFTVSAACAP